MLPAYTILRDRNNFAPHSTAQTDSVGTNVFIILCLKCRVGVFNKLWAGTSMLSLCNLLILLYYIMHVLCADVSFQSFGNLQHDANQFCIILCPSADRCGNGDSQQKYITFQNLDL